MPSISAFIAQNPVEAFGILGFCAAIAFLFFLLFVLLYTYRINPQANELTRMLYRISHLKPKLSPAKDHQDYLDFAVTERN